MHGETLDFTKKRAYAEDSREQCLMELSNSRFEISWPGNPLT